MKNIKIKRRTIGAMLLLACSFAGCKKLVDAGTPVSMVTAGAVYNSDATAAAVITNLYATTTGSIMSGGGLSSLSVFPGYSADEFSLYGGFTDQASLAFYQNNMDPIDGDFHYWNRFYPTIFIINSSIEGLNGSTVLTPAVKQQLLGESKFLRALHYFYLVNFYGDVPLVLSTNYKANELLARTPQDQVWQQIIADLKDAQNLLSPDYLDATVLTQTNQRLRPTQWAADALLARAYLYTKDWADAETAATSVIGNTALFGLRPLDSAFLCNNTEAIWQLQSVDAGINTWDGYYFNLPSTGPNTTYPIYLGPRLLSSFETGDQRQTHWVNQVTAGGVTYYYPYKYKVYKLNAPVTEYEVVFRLAEQYLIRAEARAWLGHFSDAAADLNVIRNRAGLPDYAGTLDQPSLSKAILHERQVELFSEYGHRWLDLKRTGSVDSVMTLAAPLKGNTWHSYQQWYPVPTTDLLTDPALKQNTGY